MYLVGSFQDLIDPDVPEELFHRVVLEVAIPSVHLEGIIDNFEAVVRGEELGHAAQLHSVRVPIIQGQGCIPHHGPGGHQLSRHHGQLELVVLGV